MERSEVGAGNTVVVLIYKAAWLGKREQREKRHNAIVRDVCSLLFA